MMNADGIRRRRHLRKIFSGMVPKRMWKVWSLSRWCMGQQYCAELKMQEATCKHVFTWKWPLKQCHTTWNLVTAINSWKQLTIVNIKQWSTITNHKMNQLITKCTTNTKNYNQSENWQSLISKSSTHVTLSNNSRNSSW